MSIGTFNSWLTTYKNKKKYVKSGRDPFFYLAGEYLPEQDDAIVVDVGAGSGRFAKILNLEQRFDVHLFDGNPDTVLDLRKNFRNVQNYHAPDHLPFDDNSVNFFHCSHLIEHLEYNDLYQFFGEIDRVLSVNGILAVSTPLMWERFYEDFSHIKPYGPSIFHSYFCQHTEQRTANAISNSYQIERLEYRYCSSTPCAEVGLGSRYLLVDMIVQGIKKLAYLLKIVSYSRNGYTIILRKGAKASSPVKESFRPLKKMAASSE